MRFWEKLARLTQDGGKTRAARAAGLPASAISNYISRKQTARADNALSLARALDVSLLWLVDDNRDEWPAPKFSESQPPPLSGITDREVMAEATIRYRRAIVAFLDQIALAERIDWNLAAFEVEKLQAGQPLTDNAERALAILASVEVRLAPMLQDFDLDFQSTMNHDSLPGRDRPLSTIWAAARGHSYDEFVTRADVRRFADAIQSRPELKTIPQRQMLDAYKTPAALYRKRVDVSFP